MFEDKAIPSRPFLPGYTSLRDRLGADLSLGENTIKMNTLGDVSSILITSPITLPLPNNNFTTLGVSSNSNFIIPNQTLNMTSSSEIMSQVTSSITPTSSLNLIDQQLNTLPTTEDPNLIPPSVIQEQEVSSSVIYSSNLLPSSDEFVNLYEDNIVEISQNVGYIPLDTNVAIEELYASKTPAVAALNYNKLNNTQKQNINYVIEAAKFFKVSEIETKAMLSVMSKEGGFTAVVESSYCGTTAKRLKEKIFVQILAKYTEAQVNAVKCKNSEFYSIIYGGIYGNNTSGDGYKYRGRAFNGITFKSVYQAVQNLYNTKGKPLGEIDIINNPESLEKDYKLMAYISVLYFLYSKNQHLKAASNNKTLENWVLYYARLNAGWGSNINNPTIAKGIAQAQAFAKTLPKTIY